MSWVSRVVYSREKCLTILSNILSVQRRKKLRKKKNYNWCRKAFGRSKDQFLIFKRSLWRWLEMERNFLSLIKNIHQKHSAYVVLDWETLKTFLLRSSRRQRCPFPDTHTSMDQNREPKIDPHEYVQLTFLQRCKSRSMKKDTLFSKWCWSSWMSTCNKDESRFNSQMLWNVNTKMDTELKWKV